ncbi:DUF2946 family protein [Pusillimonas sp. ANT_WB101]|uniref:DUF2946 family protein n=1 Tax=Pusillimonas sp. ANT_WB101 TaxID=2597356 RepID=UPI00165DBAB2|nr:DUF2946 family protein [Pusillimonas sp. ANT_WB101]
MMAFSGSAFRSRQSTVFRLIVSLVLLVCLVANGGIAHGYMPGGQTGDAYITLCSAKGDLKLAVLGLADEQLSEDGHGWQSNHDMNSLVCPFAVLSHAGALFDAPPAVAMPGCFVWQCLVWQRSELIHPLFVVGIPIGPRAPPIF